MNATEYRHNLEFVVAFMRAQAPLLLNIPLDDMIDQGQRALDIGPLFHPTEWIQNRKKLEEDLELMRLLKPLRDYILKLQETP